MLSTSTQFLASTTASEASESEERDRAWSWDREGERAVREDWGRSRRVVHSDTHGAGAECSVVLLENELTELHIRRGVWRSANATLKVWRRCVEPTESAGESWFKSRCQKPAAASACAAQPPCAWKLNTLRTVSVAPLKLAKSSWRVRLRPALVKFVDTTV